MKPALEIFVIEGVPDIEENDDLATILGDRLQVAGGLKDGDIVCVAQKVVSKAEGNVIRLDQVIPCEASRQVAEQLNKDPRKVEVILSESEKILNSWRRPNQDEGTLICQHRLGFISANAAVDESNTEPGTVITIPENPDASARRLGEAFEQRFGCGIGVVITDTYGRPWRLGQLNVAIGLYRVPAKVSDIGKEDAWGRRISATEHALSDEIAAATGLVVRKAAKTPLVVLRGLDWSPEPNTTARNIVPEKQQGVSM